MSSATSFYRNRGQESIARMCRYPLHAGCDSLAQPDGARRNFVADWGLAGHTVGLGEPANIVWIAILTDMKAGLRGLDFHKIWKKS
jgi:hypothetical protein